MLNLTSNFTSSSMSITVSLTYLLTLNISEDKSLGGGEASPF